MALAVGHVPVVLPRREDHGEHVDDHQVDLANDLARRGLVIQVDPDDLGPEHIREALSLRVTTRTTAQVVSSKT